MKKLLSIIVGIMLLSSFVAGCAVSKSSGSSKNGDKVTLTFANRYPDEPYKSYFDSVVKEFEKKHPNVDIQIINASNQDYKQKINVLMASNNPPDIYFSWSGEYAEKFVRAGRALDLTKYVQDDKAWSDSIIQSQFGPFTFNNKIYGVPIYMDGKAFFYNKDIFKKLGLTPPTTWDQFISELKTLKSNGYIPISFGDQENWAVGHYVTTLNQRVVDPNTLKADYNRKTGKFTDPGYVEALKKLQELVPYFTPDVNSVQNPSARMDFVNQKAAIAYNDFIEIPYFLPAKFDWGWFNFPSIDGGKGDPKQLTGSPDAFLINPATKHADVAMEFLKFLTSKPMAEKMVKETGWLSVVKGAMNSGNTNQKNIEAAKTMEDANQISIWIDAALDSKIVDTYLSGAQQVLNGEKTPQEVMDAVQKTAKEVKQSEN